MARDITVDSTLRESLKSHVQLISDRYSSYFRTAVEARFFWSGQQTDSIIDDDFKMMSWYHDHNDTIDLVAHLGELESVALLVRVVKNKPSVFFYRAPHLPGRAFFKVNKNDAFTDRIEVPPVRYNLVLSEIPHRQVVYGYIDMESGGYYDKRDSTGAEHKAQMKFYFRSQFRTFD